jgi:RNA polymerase subunit RPABC4/transcription elongation factor Spt4
MQRKKRSPIWRLPSDDFNSLVRSSKTINEVLAFFGLRNKGGNYRTLRTRAVQEGIELPVATSQRHLRIRPKIPLEEILVDGRNCSSSHLRNRLIKEGVFEDRCSECGQIPEWKGKSLTMVLDHRDGDHANNKLENLRLLCPNCNSQTPTFAGRNKKERKNCVRCGKVVSYRRKRCAVCSGEFSTRPRFHRRKVVRPLKEELAAMLRVKTMVAVAAEYAVSDKVVAKWCKAYGIETPKRGTRKQLYCSGFHVGMDATL